MLLQNYAIEFGALSECPVWESHKRGKNWCAAITPDPKSPGGLARDFWEKAKGDYYYLVPTAPIAPGPARSPTSTPSESPKAIGGGRTGRPG